MEGGAAWESVPLIRGGREPEALLQEKATSSTNSILKCLCPLVQQKEVKN